MKVLLVADNQDIKELLAFQITTRFSLTAKECSSARDAVDLLKAEPGGYDLVVGPYHGPNSVLVKHLRESASSLPIVLFFDPQVVKPEKGELDGLLVAGLVENSGLVDGVLAAVEAVYSGKDSAEDLATFCPVRTSLLIRVSPLKSDIYIRLNATKWVKLFRTGDEFELFDLEKYYQTKKIEYLYLKRSETAEFVGKFRKELEDLLARDDLKREEMLDATEMAHEAVHELVQHLGFTEEVQDLAKKNVALALKAIGANPRLNEVIGQVLKNGNYVSQHSTLLAHVACCLAKEMEWGSESTFSKLVLAAYMHDIAVKDQALAKVTSLRELKEKKASFPAEEVKSYHLHPAKAADAVRSCKDIPADVDIIVQQHHERPNGGGFPRGLLVNYIAPLSSVFIVAHELTQDILEKRGHFKLANFIEEKKGFFNQGNFRKVMKALEKAKV